MEGAEGIVRVHVRLASGVEMNMIPDDSLVIGQKIAFTDTGHVRPAKEDDTVVGVAMNSIEVWPEWSVAILEET